MKEMTKQERWRERTGFASSNWTRGYQSGYCAGSHNRPAKTLEGLAPDYVSAYLQGYARGLEKNSEKPR